MDAIQKNLLEQVAGLHEIPEGAYNIRSDGQLAGRNTTANIDIISKQDKSGIDIYIKPGTTNESVHIPVILSQSGLQELVYNDFHVGENCDVTIIAGCGIHNCGTDTSKHDGVHTFYVGKNSKVRYIERHYGEGDGRGENIMNPQTVVHLEENAYMEMETTQIKGIDSTNRITRGDLKDGATLEVREKIMTHGPVSIWDYYLTNRSRSRRTDHQRIFKIIFENRKMHAQIYACIFIAYFTGLLPASYLFCGSPQYLHYEPYITQPRPVHFIPHVVHHPCIPSLILS